MRRRGVNLAVLLTTLLIAHVVHAGTISISPSTGLVRFVPVDVGSVNYASFVVSNVGTTDLVVQSISIVGDPQFSLSSPALPATIAAGEHIDIDVLFVPQAPSGLLTSQLTIVTNDPHQQVVTLYFDGCAGPGLLAFEPDVYDFGPVVTSATADLYVRNVGCAPITFNSLSVAAPFSVLAGGGDMTLSAGTLASQIAFRLMPTSAGPFATDVTYVADAANAPSLHLTGSGGHGYLTPNYPFPLQNVTVHKVGDPVPFSLMNSGTEAVTINEIVGSNPALSLFSGPALPLSVAPGATVSFEYVCTPDHLGDTSGQIHVLTSGQRSEIEVSCLGSEPLLVSSDTDFGLQAVGVSAARALYLENRGTQPISVTSIALSGPDAADFEVNPIFAAPFVMVPGESRSSNLGISFTPSRNVGETATLTITSDDAVTPVTTLLLHGGGYSTSFTFDRTELDFGTVVVGVESRRTIDVSNVGDDQAQVFFDIEAPFRSNFSGGYMDAGTTGTIVVSLVPTSVGPLTSSLVFHTSEPPIVIPISADVRESAGSLSFDATESSIDFGSWPVGAMSDQKFVTLRNTSAQPLSIKRLGATNLAFVVSYRGPHTLEPGAASDVAVSFLSPQAGPSDGALVVYVETVDNFPEVGDSPTGFFALHANATGIQGDDDAPDGGGCNAASGGGPWWLLALFAVRRKRRRS